MKKLCLNCHEPVLGRSDKKFCTDYCRNIYNNNKNAANNNCIKEINKILKKNHAVLTEIISKKKRKVKKQDLDLKGYNFCFFTGSIKDNHGKTQYFCYDKMYFFHENEMITILEKKI